MLNKLLPFILILLLLALVGNIIGQDFQRQRGPGRMPRFGRQSNRFTNSSPTAKDDEEKKILAVLQDMFENQSRGMMNVPPDDGRIMRLFTESANAKRVVEIGTSNGYSGIWFSLALRKTGGKLITHEIDEERATLARKNFERAGVSNLVTLVFGDAHETVLKLKDQDPIDVLFIDADKSGYMDYYKKLLPLIRPGGLILAHNTDNAGPMEDFLEAITTNPNLETIFLHDQGSSLSITLKKR